MSYVNPNLVRWLNGEALDMAIESMSLDAYKGLNDLKSDMIAHKKVCKAKPGNCPYEKKVEGEIEKREKNDESDKLEEQRGKVEKPYTPDEKEKISRIEKQLKKRTEAFRKDVADKYKLMKEKYHKDVQLPIGYEDLDIDKLYKTMKDDEIPTDYRMLENYYSARMARKRLYNLQRKHEDPLYDYRKGPKEYNELYL